MGIVSNVTNSTKEDDNTVEMWWKMLQQINAQIISDNNYQSDEIFLIFH